MSSKELICITGADGTGKSTLIDRLKEYFPDAAVVTIWDAMDQQQQFRSKKEVDVYLGSLSADDRLLFLSNAMKLAMDKAMNSEAKLVLVNAYWYKYFATESALGASSQLIEQEMKKFPVPSFVFELKLSAETCASRKKQFSNYECGLCSDNSPAAFISFQERVLPHWEKFRKSDWRELDAMLEPEKLKGQVIKTVIQ